MQLHAVKHNLFGLVRLAQRLTQLFGKARGIFDKSGLTHDVFQACLAAACGFDRLSQLALLCAGELIFDSLLSLLQGVCRAGIGELTNDVVQLGIFGMGGTGLDFLFCLGDGFGVNAFEGGSKF